MTTIRAATPADAGDIEEVHTAAVREYGSGAYDDEVIDAWAAPDAETGPAADVSGMVVAERDGSVVGFGELDIEDGVIVAVYVHPDVARTGLGSSILTELERRARRENLPSLDLVSSCNAVEFYERHGYERVERTTYELHTGVEMAAVWMRKPL